MLGSERRCALCAADGLDQVAAVAPLAAPAGAVGNLALMFPDDGSILVSCNKVRREVVDPLMAPPGFWTCRKRRATCRSGCSSMTSSLLAGGAL